MSMLFAVAGIVPEKGSERKAMAESCLERRVNSLDLILTVDVAGRDDLQYLCGSRQLIFVLL